MQTLHQFQAPSESEVNDFVQYVLGWYAPGELYSRFFGDVSVTETDVRSATAILLKHYRFACPRFDCFQGDTWDRELARDIIRRQRGLYVEHDVVHQIAARVAGERQSLYVHWYPDDDDTSPADARVPAGPPCLAPLIAGTEERVQVPPEQEDAVCHWLTLPDVTTYGIWGWYS